MSRLTTCPVGPIAACTAVAQVRPALGRGDLCRRPQLEGVCVALRGEMAPRYRVFDISVDHIPRQSQLCTNPSRTVRRALRGGHANRMPIECRLVLAIRSYAPFASPGLHKTAYTPTFRGFSSYYGYYEGSEDYWTHNFYGNGLDFHDESTANCSIASGCSELVWDAVAPAKGQCDHFGRCSEPAYWKYYSTHLFTQRAVGIVDKPPAATPLFLYLA